MVSVNEIKKLISKMTYNVNTNLENICDFLENGNYYKGIKNVDLAEGDIIYVSYPTFQPSSLTFEAVPETIEHELYQPKMKLLLLMLE